ncbi:MAG: YbaK/EbsC family protein [Chloroflexi bacterium]|jgi:prolyl-tRNA editing enzyme YbaK/EbsC (Cys-tRNA(Pro) deacylase)|nr:YbaK/EbsC family protein [Chloroflexota bacterium]MBT3668952.1 YbaK/EbsC family protein [Chloroflexota bacterium]MBT4004314.1 YbaK/EbsC family protein [Chloroflexota bacterium]MBT4305321.1 YbaK/EbsC family protein [Chloroflexota bacterium]MBT4532467.1 YbaK/EbsC family protein [Chloroflexota bacterium]
MTLKTSAQKVQDAVTALGFDFNILEFNETTRTSADAAVAIGCAVDQIAKSLVFKTKITGRAILVIASGSNMVNIKLIKAEVGENITRPDADFVKGQTGFAIGGIPPIGHAQNLTTFIDEDLFLYEDIWAAAGTPNAVFRLTPKELEKMTGGKVMPMKKVSK